MDNGRCMMEDGEEEKMPDSGYRMAGDCPKDSLEENWSDGIGKMGDGKWGGGWQ